MSNASREWKALIKQFNAHRGGTWVWHYDSDGVGVFDDFIEPLPVVPRKKQSLRAYRAYRRSTERVFKQKRKKALNEASSKHCTLRFFFLDCEPVSEMYEIMQYRLDYMPMRLFHLRYVLKRR